MVSAQVWRAAGRQGGLQHVLEVAVEDGGCIGERCTRANRRACRFQAQIQARVIHELRVDDFLCGIEGEVGGGSGEFSAAEEPENVVVVNKVVTDHVATDNPVVGGKNVIAEGDRL